MQHSPPRWTGRACVDVRGSYRYDIDARSTTWLGGVSAIHELPVSGGVPNAEIMTFSPEPDRSTFLVGVMRTLDTGEPFGMEADFITAKHQRRRVRCSCEIELSRGKPVALVGVIQDITERHALEERLRQQASTDALTQLANRAEFHRVLNDRLREADAASQELAVLVIDLDGFKSVNDALGHAAGDDVLRRVADRLRRPCHDGCFSARLGGDEFAVIVPAEVGRTELAPMVDRLLRDLEIVTSAGGHIARVSGTVGIAWSGGARGDGHKLLRQADTALYAAKRSRKGSAETYLPDDTAAGYTG